MKKNNLAFFRFIFFYWFLKNVSGITKDQDFLNPESKPLKIGRLPIPANDYSELKVVEIIEFGLSENSDSCDHIFTDYYLINSVLPIYIENIPVGANYRIKIAKVQALYQKRNELYYIISTKK
jgi:hypothetical protein